MIHEIFISCCILHNKLLDYSWDDWSKYMDEVVEDDEFEYAEETQDESVCGMEQRRSSNYEKAWFNAWWEGLIEHYHHCREKGSVHWLH